MTAGVTALHARAVALGMEVQWRDIQGRRRQVADAALADVLSRLDGIDHDPAGSLLTCIVGATVPIAASAKHAASWEDEAGALEPAISVSDGLWQAPSRPGYWRWLQGRRVQPVAVAPPRAWYPPRTGPCRHWGLAAQVYSVRGCGDGGIGDSQGALGWLGQIHRHGGHALGLSPIHRGMTGGYRPYSPSDRTAFEAVHGSPMQVFPRAATAVRTADPALDARLCAHEAATSMDWAAAAADKREWLQRTGDWLREHDPIQWQACMTARDGATTTLECFAQWVVREGWARVQQQARALGMGIGLIADLAVGFDPAGEEAQRNAGSVLHGLQLGAPPDAFNPEGQAWGITSFSPQALRRTGYAPFIALLRATMADRGGLRVDHILGLWRLWLVPCGAEPAQGVYLRYPFQDLLNLLVLESWRHRCLIIGEDLGVIPDGIRRCLARRGVLGTEVLQFNHDEAGFMPLRRWRSRAVAMPSTHDLPPIAAWLQGDDLRWRRRVGWTSGAETAAALQQRSQHVAQLTERVCAEGITPTDPLADALRLVACSPAVLALMPLEDICGVRCQPNMPGTVEQHPNWCHRLPEAAETAPGVEQRLVAVSTARTASAGVAGLDDQAEAVSTSEVDDGD
ncbi:4-alpha-glucanotransferase [Stenotrophomonas sp. C3(2023)]|uniref:4-alpha-glucanotransferase n=1 Tax=Stenotrophomonas sp. C3(2023) TaxID=3080277 RepID=UPI00293CBFFB|nr:4-alpha-glucanotransferase [Stenotrophomonas sp. C3(2023)]MDV3468565.1 4-alpha-glucanotransferase [Stenotrophomonas sp. C3(2023)]